MLAFKPVTSMFEQTGRRFPPRGLRLMAEIACLAAD